MLDLSPDKILMLAVVALVVLGPNRLPQAARTLGRFVGQMRAVSASLQDEVRDALHDPEQSLASAVADLRPPNVGRAVRQAVTDTLAPPAQPPSGRPASQGPGPSGAPAPDDPSFN